MQVLRHLDRLAQARVGHRRVGGHELDPRADRTGEHRGLADRLARGVGPVDAHDDRAEHDSAPQTSFTIAMMQPASTNTTIAACIQIQVGDTSSARQRGVDVGAGLAQRGVEGEVRGGDASLRSRDAGLRRVLDRRDEARDVVVPGHEDPDEAAVLGGRLGRDVEAAQRDDRVFDRGGEAIERAAVLGGRARLRRGGLDALGVRLVRGLGGGEVTDVAVLVGVVVTTRRKHQCGDEERGNRRGTREPGHVRRA